MLFVKATERVFEMRKITEDAIRAFRNRDKFKRGNTEVRVYGEQRLLMLHGNTIAVLEAKPYGSNFVTTLSKGIEFAWVYEGEY